MTFPDFGNPELNRASDLMKTNPQQALQICVKCQKDEPENTDIDHLIVQAYRRLGDYQAAHEAASAYISKEPQTHRGYWKRAEMAFRLRDYKGAIADAKLAKEKNTTKTLGSLPDRTIALSHAHLGNLDQAVSYASQMEELEPNEWYAPIAGLPAGTKSQFTEMVKRTAQNVQQGRSNNVKS